MQSVMLVRYVFLIKRVFSHHESLLQYPRISVIPVIAFLKKDVGNG